MAVRRLLPLALPAVLLLLSLALAGLWPSDSARALPPAGSDPFTVTGSVTVSSRLGTETIALTGTATITRQDPHMDGDVEVEDAQLSTFDFTGDSLTGPVHITQNNAIPSNGELRSLQAGSQFPASSFFDVFVVVEAPGDTGYGSDPTITLKNDAPLHFVPVNGSGDEVSLSGWPPIGVTFGAQIEPGGAGSQVQTFPPGTGICSSGVPLNPQPPAKVCVDAASLTITGLYVPTATPTQCPPEVCTPTPTFPPGTPTSTLSPTPFPTQTPMPPGGENPSFSVAPDGPSDLHPADLFGLVGAPVQASGNDNFASPWPIFTLPFRAEQSNSAMTTEPNEPLHPPGCISFGFSKGHTVWYRYTSSAEGMLYADTSGSNYDTVLAAYTGTDLATLTPIACNDDDSGLLQSAVQFQTSFNTTYFFQVGGYEMFAGQIKFRVGRSPNFGTDTGLLNLGCSGLGLVPDGCDDGSDGDQDDIDAVSFRTDFAPGPSPVKFSVAAGSLGVPGSAVAAQVGCSDEAQADVFSSALNGQNALSWDGDGLSAGGGVCPTGQSLRLHEQPTSDDVDGFVSKPLTAIDEDGNGLPDRPVFFSLAAGSPTLASRGRGPSDIMWTDGGFAPGLYASAAALGLQPADDIDGMCLKDLGEGVPFYNPATDPIHFSLAPGSPTLTTLGASPADVLGPGPTIIHHAADLGLQASDDVDALACFTQQTSTPTPTRTRTPTPAGPVGDANCNNIVNAIDSAIVLQFVAQLLAQLNCPVRADANQNGLINAIDAVLILQFVAGMIPQLPP